MKEINEREARNTWKSWTRLRYIEDALTKTEGRCIKQGSRDIEIIFIQRSGDADRDTG